eukprot:6436282-Pyramimonas_sp.AAC.1
MCIRDSPWRAAQAPPRLRLLALQCLLPRQVKAGRPAKAKLSARIIDAVAVAAVAVVDAVVSSTFLGGPL